MASFDVVAEFKARDKQLMSALQRQERALDKQRRSIGRVQSSLSRQQRQVDATADSWDGLSRIQTSLAVGATAGVGTLIALGTQGAQNAAEMQKLALSTGLATDKLQAYYTAFARLGFEGDETQEVLEGAASLLRRLGSDEGLTEAVESVGLATESVDALLASVVEKTGQAGVNQEHFYTILTELALSSEKQWTSWFAAVQRGFDGLPTGEFAQSLLQASDRDIALADDLASRARVFVQELSRAGIILTAEVFGPLRPLLDEARQALPDFTDRLRAGGRAVGDALAWAWRNMDGLLAGARALAVLWFSRRLLPLAAAGWRTIVHTLSSGVRVQALFTRATQAAGRALRRAFVAGIILEFLDEVLRGAAALSRWAGQELPADFERSRSALEGLAAGLEAAAGIVEEFNPTEILADLDRALEGLPTARVPVAFDLPALPDVPRGGALAPEPDVLPGVIETEESVVRLSLLEVTLNRLRFAAEDFARALTDGIYQGMLDVVRGTETLLGVGRRLLAQLAELALRAAVLGPLEATIAQGLGADLGQGISTAVFGTSGSAGAPKPTIPAASAPLPAPKPTIPAASAPAPAAKPTIPAASAPAPAAKPTIPAASAPLPAPKPTIPAASAPLPAPKPTIPAASAPAPAAKPIIPAASAPLPAPKPTIPAASAPAPAAKPIIPAASAPAPSPKPTTPARPADGPVVIVVPDSFTRPLRDVPFIDRHLTPEKVQQIDEALARNVRRQNSPLREALA